MAVTVDSRLSPLRVTEGNLRRWRRTWKGSIFSNFVSPVLYLAAMGLGLGSLVDRGAGSGTLGEVSYVAFVGAGLLAATTMQNGASESSWPVMLGIKWGRSYHAMIATPVRVHDIILGHVLTAGLRLAVSASIFALVMVAFAITDVGHALLGVLPAVLTGLAFVGPVAAYTCWIDNEAALAYLFRFGIVPIFLLSGTFFPIDELPAWVHPVAWATPLWHGVQLTRAATLGWPTAWHPLVHVTYLVACAAVGTVLAIRLLERRLTP